MKKFRFVVQTGYHGCNYKTEEVFDDDVTEKELEDCLREFIFDHIEGYWEEIEGGKE